MQRIRNWLHVIRKPEEVTLWLQTVEFWMGLSWNVSSLAPLKNMSQNVVDTTELTPRGLRKTIAEQFSDQEQTQSFRIEVMSFWFQIWNSN